jgi:hypothetical protein
VGGGGEHANHRCVQVDEEGGPGNNFPDERTRSVGPKSGSVGTKMPGNATLVFSCITTELFTNLTVFKPGFHIFLWKEGSGLDWPSTSSPKRKPREFE